MELWQWQLNRSAGGQHVHPMELWQWRFNPSAGGQHVHLMELWRWRFNYSVVSLCEPMDCSPPGSSVHEIFQAGILEQGCHFLLQGSS